MIGDFDNKKSQMFRIIYLHKYANTLDLLEK